MTHDRLTTLHGNHPHSDCVQHAGLLRSMDRRTAMDNAVTSRLDETEHGASPWRVGRDVWGRPLRGGKTYHRQGSAWREGAAIRLIR